MGKYRKLGFYPSKMSKKELKVYWTLLCMHRRCNNKDDGPVKCYAGRGFAVCDRYSRTPEGMANLIADIKLPPTMKHQIDRENNNLGYVEGNLRWVTHSEQQKNRRFDNFSTAQNRPEVKAANSAGVKRALAKRKEAKLQ